MKALVDNDVLLKSARYGLLDQFLGGYPPVDDVVGVLGSARFVLTNLLVKSKEAADATEVLPRLLAFIDGNQVLEPTVDEQELAAEFEAVAQQANLPMDTGESLLCSMLIRRTLPRLITGDKRAIVAVEQLIDLCPHIRDIVGKLMCMEQLVLERLTAESLEEIKMAICRRPSADKALFICCACSSATPDIDVISEALNSYIRSLRTTAQRALCA